MTPVARIERINRWLRAADGGTMPDSIWVWPLLDCNPADCEAGCTINGSACGFCRAYWRRADRLSRANDLFAAELRWVAYRAGVEAIVEMQQFERTKNV